MSEPLTTIIWQRFSHSSTTTGSTPCGICGKRGWAHTDVAPTRSQGCGCYDDWRKTTTASGLPQPDSTIFRSIRQSSTSPSILPSLSRKARKLLGYLVCKRWDTLCFDAFCHTLTKKTVIVVDNASIHTSDDFADRLPYWKK